MPIWSIGEINESGCETTFRKDGGVINHLETGNRIDVMESMGVYVIKMQVPKHMVKDKDGHFQRHGPAP